MAGSDLILQHSQQIGNDIQSFRQQPDALVHFKIAAHGAVDGLELRFRPHELRAIKHRSLQVDVDAQDEELSDLHRDLAPRQRNPAREGNLFGKRSCKSYRGGDEVFEERGLLVGGLVGRRCKNDA